MNTSTYLQVWNNNDRLFYERLLVEIKKGLKIKIAGNGKGLDCGEWYGYVWLEEGVLYFQSRGKMDWQTCPKVLAEEAIGSYGMDCIARNFARVFQQGNLPSGGLSNGMEPVQSSGSYVVMTPYLDRVASQW